MPAIMLCIAQAAAAAQADFHPLTCFTSHKPQKTHFLPVHTHCRAEDLEEALLFDFDGDESSSFTPTKGAPRGGLLVTNSSLVSTAGSTASLLPSLPSVLSQVRSVTKDAAGTHVLTENFTLHIEEVRGGNGGGGCANGCGCSERQLCRRPLQHH